tara:strand:- start:2244 stop:2486 length:243 start_codon:yes stop_codon:yes gene_type:complete
MTKISEAPEEQIEGYLATMLEGYETNLKGVTQFIEQAEAQLSGAMEQKEEIVSKIEELKVLLDLEEEVESPKLEIVKEAE